ncbi:hypothetical protein QVD17_18327 [Tagetes erecta]|uniref:Uncharacterized protein n=1 Tax=Tagetes erecta TaxID=13708 RepID=A0AAD8NW65_TARER|nr:hypothetical protein QVD17_18327 [Tagetes erecta]
MVFHGCRNVLVKIADIMVCRVKSRVSRSHSLVPKFSHLQFRVLKLIFTCSIAIFQLFLIFGINFQTWCSIISRKSLKYLRVRILLI